MAKVQLEYPALLQLDPCVPIAPRDKEALNQALSNSIFMYVLRLRMVSTRVSKVRILKNAP
jgi:hypothetical protein